MSRTALPPPTRRLLTPRATRDCVPARRRTPRRPPNLAKWPRRRAVACQEVAAAPSSASERRKVYKLHMAALRDELYSIPSDVSNPETVRVALEMARLASLDGWTLCPTALFLEYHTL